MKNMYMICIVHWTHRMEKMIFDVFSSEKSACLDNSPVVHVKHIDPRVQEVKRDSTEQCKIMYNSQSRSCKPEVYPSIPYCPTV